MRFVRLISILCVGPLICLQQATGAPAGYQFDVTSPHYDPSLCAKLTIDWSGLHVGGRHFSTFPSFDAAGGYAVNEWLESGRVRARRIIIPKKTGGAQRIPFIVPPPHSKSLSEYNEKIVPKTMSFGYVRGWFDGQDWPYPFSPPKIHAYVRVGGRLFYFHLDEVITDASYLWVQSELLTRPTRPVAFETLFEMPEKGRADLLKYFRERAGYRATIGGVRVVPKYDPGGFGQLGDQGAILENCITFALSWRQARWWRDYPGLGAITDATETRDLGDVETIDSDTIPALLMNSRPLAVVAWGKDIQGVEATPEIEYLKQLRVMRRLGLKDHEITSDLTWDLTSPP